MLLKGKTAVVTGGTRGIGAGVVRKFIENGARVAVCGSRRETAEQAVEKFRKEYPEAELMALWPALGSPESVAEAFGDVVKRFGSLDILVNNAGLSARDKLYDYRYEDYVRVMELNVNSVFVCSQAAARIMRGQGGGVILNTSSMVSKMGQPSGVAYPASKFAVNGLTVSLARELGPDNIRVCAVAPGVTKTDMMANVPEEMLKPVIAGIPLRRIGEPEDIANAFLFLASDMASYITGAVLPVDGGCTT